VSLVCLCLLEVAWFCFPQPRRGKHCSGSRTFGLLLCGFVEHSYRIHMDGHL
jgi:hypothetical protein